MIHVLSVDFLKILAKRGRVEVIRTLKAYSDRDFTINELAKAAKIPTMTAWRAVKDLKKVGLVRTRKVGNATSVSITDDRDRLRTLRLIPETDPQRMAARLFGGKLAENGWLEECKLFGTVGRGEHSPGEEVDVAVVYDDSKVTEADAKEASTSVAGSLKSETNVTIVPLCIAQKDMARRGGLGSELRDKESIWRRKI
jgi:predicted transcriptional regulator/predicted nucleotidyltransferase